MSRDQARTPMQWDGSPGAGFTTGTPWLAINPDHVAVNAAAQRRDPDSVYHHHRRLIALRHDDPVVTEGDFELLLPDHPSVWAFVRRSRHGRLAVAANCTSVPVTVDLGLGPTWQPATVVLANLPDPGGLSDNVTLRPWESIVWRCPEQAFEV